jgi:hypothetical protein
MDHHTFIDRYNDALESLSFAGHQALVAMGTLSIEMFKAGFEAGSRDTFKTSQTYDPSGNPMYDPEDITSSNFARKVLKTIKRLCVRKRDNEDSVGTAIFMLYGLLFSTWTYEGGLLFEPLNADTADILKDILEDRELSERFMEALDEQESKDFQSFLSHLNH